MRGFKYELDQYSMAVQVGAEVEPQQWRPFRLSAPGVQHVGREAMACGLVFLYSACREPRESGTTRLWGLGTARRGRGSEGTRQRCVWRRGEDESAV